MTAHDPTQGRPPAEVQLNLTRADIGFSAAHFSIVGGRAERLHGHNYRVELRARGSLRADGTLVDFAVLKRALRDVCASLDERTLLPLHSDRVAVREDGDQVDVVEGTRHFRFPREDVRLLPIPNTTCESLATHLMLAVRARLGDAPVRLELTVEETPGQSATVAE
ncbi:MAG: 6-carboxytetrahydropterin synthase [Candidatus Dormibacteraeota bacterium]|nr:6-carboxytetrahydropterin synthase [Candidatus Dormibacteraeota bacterium]